MSQSFSPRLGFLCDKKFGTLLNKYNLDLVDIKRTARTSTESKLAKTVSWMGATQIHRRIYDRIQPGYTKWLDIKQKLTLLENSS